MPEIYPTTICLQHSRLHSINDKHTIFEIPYQIQLGIHRWLQVKDDAFHRASAGNYEHLILSWPE